MEKGEVRGRSELERVREGERKKSRSN